VSWARGDTIVLRQVWHGRPWAAIPLVVVSDEPELLLTYLAERTPFGFASGDFPGGTHPWEERGRWQGHGTLMLRRPRDPYSVWVFWRGEQRDFSCWYLNFEEPFRRSAIGIDTLDHELDLLSRDGRTWTRKDEEMLASRVADGRFSAAVAEQVRRDAAAFEAEYAANGPWWDPAWANWRPPAGFAAPALPDGWAHIPAA
jgi:hypothetical protein